MTQFRRAAFLAIAGPALATAVLAQAPAPRSEPSRGAGQEFLAVPANVKAEGLPPIPASIVQDLAPYAASRRALLLGWHPSRREILMTTALGDTFQIHSVAGPGMDRHQLRFLPGGVRPSNVGAWYSPDGSYFVFSKDATSGTE